MTVVAYAGRPGSGKTSNVVEHQIIPALKAGRTVYHNLSLNEVALRILAGDKGTLVQFDRETATAAELVANAPPGALVVIDESWRYWRAGIKSNNVPEDEFKFFAMHRHSVGQDGRAMDVVIVSQDLGTGVAAFIRQLVEVTYLSITLTGVGVKSRYRIEVYNGCVTGQEPPKSKLLRTLVVKRNPAIFNCYQSHTLSQTGQAGLEEASDTRASLWKSWPIIGAGVAIPVFIVSVWHVWGFSNLAGKKPAPARERSDRAGAAVGSLVSGALSPPQIASVLPADSRQWRLVGRIRAGFQDFFLIESETGVIRVSPKLCTTDPVGNWSCIWHGQLVADWTGPPSPAFNKMFAGSLSGKADSVKVE